MLIGLAPLGACDTLGLTDEDPVSVSFAVPGPSGVRSAAVVADPITDGTHTLDLQSVDVVFDEIVLKRSKSEENDSEDDADDNDDDGDSDKDGRSNQKFRTGPVTIALPVQGGVITPLNAPIAEGFYEEIRLDVAFIRVRGTFDGQAFDVTVPANTKFEHEFEPPFEVTSDADRLNVTVLIDARTWFRGSDGKLVDPRLITTSSSARAAVVQRIKSSFRAFEDSDRDADDQDSDSDRGHR